VPFPAEGLVDGDVRVRLPRVEDAPAILRGLTDPQIVHDAGIQRQDGLSEEVVAGRITTSWAQARRQGDFAPFAIADAVSDEYLGNVLLHTFDWEQRRCEIGYWLLPEARGRGLSARAARLLAVWAIDVVGMERVEAVVDVDNVASLRSIERAGFSKEGVARSLFRQQRGRADAAVYALVRADLPRRRTRPKSV